MGWPRNLQHEHKFVVTLSIYRGKSQTLGQAQKGQIHGKKGDKMKIKLGYEMETGKLVEFSADHIIVTGMTQLSGKTTTLESLVKESKKKAIVFRTKIGEKSFLDGTIIPPYFKDRSDWKFIKGMVESTMKMRIDKFEQATIINLCKETGGNSLLDFKKKVDQKLGEKISANAKVTLTNLQAYLEEVVPKLQTITFSNTLDLVEGLNIINLERFSRDSQVQGLIIASVLDEVLYNHKDVIVLIPEAWKFIPQERGSPCKLALEEFIRQGATNRNYIWIDSQDMSGVDKGPLKQISTWILGYQSEKNEVKHTLEQIPLPNSQKPKADDIMRLGMGIFYLATREETVKTYVQPWWLDDDKIAIKIAKGKMKVTDIDKPQTLTPNRIAPRKEPSGMMEFDDTKIRQDINEIRQDFFDKVSDLQQQIIDTKILINDLKNSQPVLDEATIVMKVLQKMPAAPAPVSVTPVNTEAVIAEVLKRMPKQTGANVYEVAPLEKLRRDFLEETKSMILADIGNLSDNAKRLLKYLEAGGKGVKSLELEEKCFFLKHSGSSSDKVSKSSLELRAIEVADKDTAGFHRGRLKARIQNMLSTHGATEAEIDQVYSHIIMELLK